MWTRTVTGFRLMLDRLTPWLLDLGSWICGALIAFNLVIVGALLTIGPVDHAVVIAAAAFALALPLDVAAFLLLRLAADIKKIGLDQAATGAFVEAGFVAEGGAPAADQDEIEARRGRVVLRYSYALLTLGLLLTLIGITAALWHMSWWIALAFVVMVLLSQTAVFVAITSTGSRAVWRSPAGPTKPRDQT